MKTTCYELLYRNMSVYLVFFIFSTTTARHDTIVILSSANRNLSGQISLIDVELQRLGRFLENPLYGKPTLWKTTAGGQAQMPQFKVHVAEFVLSSRYLPWHAFHVVLLAQA
jgi:hypothetical protein